MLIGLILQFNMPRGKGVRKSSRKSTSPYQRESDSRESAAPASQTTHSSSLSSQQLDDVVSKVSARVTPHIVEAVQQAIAVPTTPSIPEGNTGLLNLNEFDPSAYQVSSVSTDLAANISDAVRQPSENHKSRVYKFRAVNGEAKTPQ